MDKELRDRLFMAALMRGLITHETAMRDVEDILEGLARRYGADGLDGTPPTPAPGDKSE